MIQLDECLANITKFLETKALFTECLITKTNIPMNYNTSQVKTLLKSGNEQLLLAYTYGNSLDNITKALAGTHYSGMSFGILRNMNNPYITDFATKITHKIDRPGYVVGFENFLRYIISFFEHIQKFILDPEDDSQNAQILVIQVDNNYLPLLDTWELKHFDEETKALEAAREILKHKF